MTEFLQSSDIFEALPYTILSLGSFVVLMLALAFKKRENRGVFWFTSLVIASAAFFTLFNIGVDQYPMGGMLVHDSIGFPFAFTILLTLMMVLPILPYETKSLNEMPSAVTSLLLLSACGALIMIYSNHLMVFFIGLELLSLPLYVLTGIGFRTGQSSEASFKYFLLGSISSAIFVYGTSLIWATLGTLQINDMVEIFSTKLVDHSSVTLWMGMVMVAASLLFKLGVFPFHLWIPDVYQSAPASIVAWMSSATKSATVVILIRLLAPLPETVQHSWVLPLSLLAVGSMVWGSLGALYQTNVRRMLGYSTIAHAGYAMVAVVSVIGQPIQNTAPVFGVLFLGVWNFKFDFIHCCFR
jgi:NADH-quinone oxidoreductase subunit N